MDGAKVFAWSPRRKWTVLGSFLLFLSLAIAATSVCITRGTREFAYEATVTWVVVAFVLRGVHRVLGTIKVHDESITYSNIGVSVRINFKDVTAVKYRPEWQYVELRSLNSKIICHRSYRDIDRLIEILGRKVPLVTQQEGQREPEKDVTEFGYSLRYRMMMVLGLLLFTGMTIASICPPESDRILASGFSAFALLAVYCVYATSQKVVLMDDCLVSQWVGRRRTICYEDITRIVRGVSLGYEYIRVFSPKTRIECSSQLRNYQTLVRRLEKIAPIRWKREELVTMPMILHTRWWLEPAIGIPMGIVMTSGCLYVFLKLLKKGGPAFRFIVFGAASCGALGILASAIYKFFKTPRKYAFYPDRIVITTGVGRRVLSADSVREIALRRWPASGGGGRSGFDIRLESDSISLEQGNTNIPLVPLYELLRRTYTPDFTNERPGDCRDS